MKIGVIENYSSSTEICWGRRNEDPTYYQKQSYIYTFYSDISEISQEEYKIIYDCFVSWNSSLTEEVYGVIHECPHRAYDVDKSSILAEKLGCLIFEPGIYPHGVFKHDISREYTGTYDSKNSLIWSYKAKVTELKTLSVIKYMTLIMRKEYWEPSDPVFGIQIDEDENLCHQNYSGNYKLSVLLADHFDCSYDNFSFEELAVVVKDNRWGIVSSQGEFVVQYQDYHITRIYETFCVVERNGLSSCMSFDGRILMPFTTQEFVIHRDDRYAEVKLGSYRLLYDLEYSKVILSAECDGIIDITENLIIVSVNNSSIYDIYNHNSLKVNEKPIISVCHSAEMIVCKTDNGWVVYDKGGNIVLTDNKNEYVSIEETTAGHLQLMKKNVNNYSIYGLTDNNGNVIFHCYSDSPIKIFESEGYYYYIIRKYKKEYLCNCSGKVLSAKYDFIRRGSDGICIAYDGKPIIESDRYNYINCVFYAISLKGKVLFKLNCQSLSSFKNGYATIVLNDKYGKINKEGHMVIPAIYDDIGILSQGLLYAYKDDYYGYIDISNNIVIEFKYDKAEDFQDDGVAYVERFGEYAYINNKGEVVIDWQMTECLGSGYISPIDDEQYIRDGLTEAFNDDSGNYWNID